MSSRVDSVQAIPPFWEPYSESVPLVPSGDPEIGFPYSTVAIAPATRTPSQLFASMPHPSPAYATLYPNLSISENQFYRRPDDHLTHASARSTQGFRMDDTTSSQQDHSCIHDRNYYSETDILSIVTGGNRTLSVPVGYRQSVPDSDDGQGASLDNVMKPTKFIAFSPNSKPTASSSRKNPRPRASRSRTEMPRPISDRAKHGCITCRVRQKKCSGVDPGQTDCAECLRLNMQCLKFSHSGPSRRHWLRNPEALKETKQRMKHFLANRSVPRGHGPAPEQPRLDFDDLVEKYSPRVLSPEEYKNPSTIVLPESLHRMGSERPVHTGGDLTILSGDHPVAARDARPGTDSNQLDAHAGSVAISSDNTSTSSPLYGYNDQNWNLLQEWLQPIPLDSTPQQHTQQAQSVAFSPLSSEKTTSRSVVNLQSKEMSAQGMFECLTQHGCPDLTAAINPEATSCYRVVAGGFGDIWKGKFYNGTEIAIKVWRLDPTADDPEMNKSLKRATRELYNWSKANHENVHKLLGVTIFEGQLAMVSQWMENGHLRDYINRNKAIDRYQLCIQVAKGVHYLHHENMVHGDLKACNILVSSDGVAKLADFDHSIITDCSLVFSATTHKGGGTVRWMAPELVLETSHSRSKQTDIYALGMTLLEAITGTIPYFPQCRHDAQVINKLIQKIPPERTEPFNHSERGSRMWALLLQCWNHDPTARPTALEVLNSLCRLMDETSQVVQSGASA